MTIKRDLRHRDWTPELEVRLQQINTTGASYREIARTMGLTKNTVRGKLERLGLADRGTCIKPTVERPRPIERPPLPAGHPIALAVLKEAGIWIGM
jgi:hypothetical protein